MNQHSIGSNHDRRVNFGSYLKHLRKQAKLRQNKVAFDLRISPAELCYIEKGDRGVPDRLLAELATKYGVSLEVILTRKYWPQLPLLSSVVEPPGDLKDIIKDLSPNEEEEVKRYIAFLRLSRATYKGT